MPTPVTPVQALRGALAGASRDSQVMPRRQVLVVGAAGPLGSAVLERLLRHVAPLPLVLLVHRPIDVAMAGLQAWPVPAGPIMAADLPPQIDTAVVVLDPARSRHGREAAIVRPLPHDLPALAGSLQQAGVRRLVLVLPHAPALLPPALRSGLASIDEHAVARAGFEQLVLVRPSRHGAAQGHHDGGVHQRGHLLDRLAGALLAQLHWMMPQREQPLRADKVAEAVAALVRGLPGGHAGIRVLTPEALWDWAQPGAGAAWMDAWLRHQPLPTVALPVRRW